MLPVNGGAGRDKTKYEDKFTMNVPKFDPDMKLNWDEDGTVVFQPEVAEYSCYRIAHQKAWKNKYETDPKAVAVSTEAGSASAEESEEEEGTRGVKWNRGKGGK